MHWKHSRFEIAYIILGNCHTFDEAYRILCELEEDRNFSIESALAESLRAQSKVITAKVILNDTNESKSGKINAECNVAEQKARSKIAQPCMDEARRELSFIRMLKDIVNDNRRFKDYPDHIAHQLAQPIEWMFDLHWKTYNYLASAGSIPYDHIMQMKMHPDSQNLLQAASNLRDSMINDPNEFFLQDKMRVLSGIASPGDRPYMLSKDVFKENQVLEAWNLEIDDAEMKHIEFGKEHRSSDDEV